MVLVALLFISLGFIFLALFYCEGQLLLPFYRIPFFACAQVSVNLQSEYFNTSQLSISNEGKTPKLQEL